VNIIFLSLQIEANTSWNIVTMKDFYFFSPSKNDDDDNNNNNNNNNNTCQMSKPNKKD
jgi:hypothetical protein